MVRVVRRAGVRSQWKTALEKRRSILVGLPGGVWGWEAWCAVGEKLDRSAWMKGWSGSAVRALDSMSALESTPVLRAPGKAERSAEVLFPGPQPRS